VSTGWAETTPTRGKAANGDIKEPLSWIFENDCSYGVEYSSKGMKTSCKDLYLKVHRI